MVRQRSSWNNFLHLVQFPLRSALTACCWWTARMSLSKLTKGGLLCFFEWMRICKPLKMLIWQLASTTKKSRKFFSCFFYLWKKYAARLQLWPLIAKPVWLSDRLWQFCWFSIGRSVLVNQLILMLHIKDVKSRNTSILLWYHVFKTMWSLFITHSIVLKVPKLQSDFQMKAAQIKLPGRK